MLDIRYFFIFLFILLGSGKVHANCGDILRYGIYDYNNVDSSYNKSHHFRHRFCETVVRKYNNYSDIEADLTIPLDLPVEIGGGYKRNNWHEYSNYLCSDKSINIDTLRAINLSSRRISTAVTKAWSECKKGTKFGVRSIFHVVNPGSVLIEAEYKSPNNDEDLGGVEFRIANEVNIKCEKSNPINGVYGNRCKVEKIYENASLTLISNRRWYGTGDTKINYIIPAQLNPSIIIQSTFYSVKDDFKEPSVDLACKKGFDGIIKSRCNDRRNCLEVIPVGASCNYEKERQYRSDWNWKISWVCVGYTENEDGGSVGGQRQSDYPIKLGAPGAEIKCEEKQ